MSQKIEMDRASFLIFVRQYVESDPETAAHIGDAAQAGLRAALNKAYERAADMEIKKLWRQLWPVIAEIEDERE